MTPEDFQRINDWIRVREALLGRLASLDPKEAKDKNIRSMYAHVLVALRRATVTLVRIIADDARTSDIDDGKGTREDHPCFTWKGINYLAKICQDTAFLDGIEELQNYFGVKFQDNPLVAEETLSGDDARVEYNARGIRCDFPPRRRRFFRGLNTETVQFVHDVLRRAQRHEAGLGKRSDIVGNDESSLEAHKGPETPKAAEEETQQPSLQERPRVNEGLLHEFTQRTAARRREIMLCFALREWSALTAQLRNARAKVNLRFEIKQRVRNLAAQREALVAFRRFAANKERAREAAEEILVGRRAAMARRALLALAMTLKRGRTLQEATGALKARVNAAGALRAKSRVMAALSKACGEARVVHRRAEDLREVGLARLLIKSFQAWARAAGLSGRLRNRLSRADQGLLENVMSAWVLFTQHSINKRVRREERTVRRANRAWDTEVLDEAFFDWANATAAGKFRRLRLSSRALHGWREAARASSAGNAEIQLR